MVPTDRLLAFALLAFLIIVVPGPSVLFTIGRALAHGRRTALASVLGNALGGLVLAATVAVGLGALVERSVLAFTTIKYAGAAYLVYLGIKAFRSRGTLAATLEAMPDRAGRRSLREGFVVGVTNPKTTVFFAAVLPQFVARDHGHVALQMLELGLVFSLIAVLSDSVWGLLAAAARSWFGRSPRRLGLVGGTGGLTMIGLGVGIAVTGRAD